MPSLFGQVVIPHRDLILASSVVNTFNWTGIDDVEDMCTAAYGRVITFYNTTPPSGTFPLVRYMSTELNLPGARLKLYDASDPEPRVPVFDESLGLVTGTPGDVNNLPAEVALCTSYSAEVVSGGNIRRRRGRLYLGPFNQSANNNTTQATARPNSAFSNNVVKATQKLAEDNTLGVAWAVYSRVDETFATIHQGWVDNAWDTQRRRGAPATLRTSWEVETDP